MNTIGIENNLDRAQFDAFSRELAEKRPAETKMK